MEMRREREMVEESKRKNEEVRCSGRFRTPEGVLFVFAALNF